MKTYEVTNPYIVCSIPNGENGRKEVTLQQGDTVELPENDITVRALLARQQIKEVAGKTAETAGSKKK